MLTAFSLKSGEVLAPLTVSLILPVTVLLQSQYPCQVGTGLVALRFSSAPLIWRNMMQHIVIARKTIQWSF